MKKTLNIGSMRLPKESATKGFGFIGKRGSGKSYGAAVFAEELFAAKIPFVVFDPIDVWWGLKVAADGKGKGLPVVVFGKEHADIQLDRTMGKRIAEAVVKDNISCIISTFGMNKTEMREIVADFSERLLQINNTPRQVIIEEAHEYVPQRVGGAMARCFSAVEALLVMGRNRGIGVSLLNQRMATLNKDLLTQIDVLVAFRSVGPQDRKAFRDWVEVHNEENDEHFNEFMRSVPSLPTGTAWVWSPEFLEKFERVKFRKRETFHPDREKLGMTFKMPEIKQGDVQSFIDSFSKKPEKTVEVYNKHSRRPLLATQPPQILKQDIADEYKRGRAEGIEEGKVAGAVQVTTRYEALIKKCVQLLLRTHNNIERALEIFKEERAAGERESPTRIRPLAAPPATEYEKFERAVNKSFGISAGSVSKPEQKILDSIAWMHAIGVRYPYKNAIALVAKVRPTSGGYQNNLSKLRSAGLIDYPEPGKVALTESGQVHATVPDINVSTNEELHRIILESLSTPEGNVLRPLLSGEEMSKYDLAVRTPYQHTSGGYQNILSTLRSMGLIDYPKPGQVVATDVLFPFKD